MCIRIGMCNVCAMCTYFVLSILYMYTNTRNAIVYFHDDVFLFNKYTFLFAVEMFQHVYCFIFKFY